MNKMIPIPIPVAFRPKDVMCGLLLVCIQMILSACMASELKQDVLGQTLSPISSSKEADGTSLLLDTNAIQQIEERNELDLTMTDSVLMGLEQNPELSIQKLSPEFRKISVLLEQSIFDPSISSQLSARKSRSPGGFGDVENESLSGDLALDKFFSTGTSAGISLQSNLQDSAVPNANDESTRLALNVNQSLLRGAGTNVNLASIRQAKLDVLTSEFELRGYAESFVASIEKSYWNHYLAKKRVEIYEQSLDVAEQQEFDSQERVNVGQLAETEMAAAKAEVALREEALINARSRIETTRFALLQLLHPPIENYWNLDVQLLDRPNDQLIELTEPESYVEVALNRRPEIHQLDYERQRNELEIIKTKNGLLPLLDVFVTLGGTGYASSFGDSIGNLNGDHYDLQTGFQFQYPLFNRSAKARYRQSLLNQEQTELAIENLKQTIQVDVRSAYVELMRTSEQIHATQATRELQEEKYVTENEKFKVGKSTGILVAAAQRDLVGSQLDELEAKVNYQIALIDFFRLEGTLLDRRGLGIQFANE